MKFESTLVVPLTKISIQLWKRDIWIDEKGRKRDFCYDSDSDTLKQCSAIFEEPVNQWFSSELKFGNGVTFKQAVSDYFRKQVHPSVHCALDYNFTDWNQLPRLLDELNGIFPDNAWFEDFHNQERLLWQYRQNEVTDFVSAIEEKIKSNMDEIAKTDEKQRKSALEKFGGWTDKDFGKIWERKSWNYCLQNYSKTDMRMFFDYDRPSKSEEFAKKKNGNTYYKCNCGQKFKTVEEFEAHRAETVVPAYCLRIYPRDVMDGGCFELHMEHGELTKCVENPKANTTWYFKDGYYSFKNLSLDDLFSNVSYKLGEREIVAGEFIAESEVKGRKFDSLIIFFKDLSELPTAFHALSCSYFPFLVKRMVEEKNGYDNASHEFESIAKGDFDRAIGRLKNELDAIGKIIEGRKWFTLRLKGYGKAEVQVRKSDVDTDNGTKSFNLGDGSISLVKTALGKVPKKKLTLEEKLGYKKDDLFLMRINGLWYADEIKFSFHEVVTGEQRWKLEKKAEESDCCRISFGSNESQEYSDILSEITFDKISQSDNEVLVRLDVAHGGELSYEKIMNGFDAEDDEDEDWDDWEQEED